MAEKVIIRKDFKLAQQKYPKLKLCFEGDKFECQGEIDIFDIHNVYWETFEIKIVFEIKKYPHFFPILFLTDNKIPICDDRHINQDSSCCVEVEPKQILRAQKGITIIQFIDEFALPYFANQLYYEKEKEWANNDYKHGFDGVLQYYFELTGITDYAILVKLLKNLERYKSFKIYDDCFCGSSKKIKFCHKKSLFTLLKIPNSKIKSDIEIIENIKLRKQNKNGSKFH